MERTRLGAVAAQKAAAIIAKCIPEQHAYLHKKGFKELQGLVWRPKEDSNILCIPMTIGGKISSVQFINREGEKKFLTNGVTARAEYVFQRGTGADFWVEEYESGLSLRACLDALKRPYRIHVCFSAQNLQKMAHSGLVVADHDKSGVGEKAAQATRLPYFMPEKQGEDINDLHQSIGTFACSQKIREWLQGVKDQQDYDSGL